MAGQEPPRDAELLGLALEAAREAAELVGSLRAVGVAVADTKSSPVDVVTEADQQSEELLRRRLLGARPDDGFLGEEGEVVTGTSGVRWVVDPIDGTVNYLYGLPAYAVSVAAERDGRVVAGAVVNPAAGLEYAAHLGGGATRNGEPLRVRPAPPLEESLVATGFGYEAQVRARQAAAVGRMLPRVRDIRRVGSCALDLCAVAAGQVDAYVEEGVNPWDHAAGGLVAAEAGAVVEVWTTTGGRDLLVCAPEAAWAAFSHLVRECGFLGEQAAPGAR